MWGTSSPSEKLTGGFDNGLGAILIGEHSLVLFLSKKSAEGISGLFQQYRQRVTLLDGLPRSASIDCGLSGSKGVLLLSVNYGISILIRSARRHGRVVSAAQAARAPLLHSY